LLTWGTASEENNLGFEIQRFGNLWMAVSFGDGHFFSGIIENQSTAEELEWTAYPNPATNEVIIKYKLPEDAKNPVLLISDSNGRTVLQKVLDVDVSLFIWNASDGKDGVYFYTLKYDNRIQQTKQILLMK